jgi:hypothetical protein
MICHVVLIRLKPEATEEDGSNLLDRARKLLAPIPSVRNFRAGRGLGKKDEVSHPYALVMEFEDEAALQDYQVHPDHQFFVREVVGPVQADKKVYEYEY